MVHLPVYCEHRKQRNGGARVEAREPLRLQLPDKMRVVDHAYQSLEEAIFTGKLRPGDRLIEQQVCVELQVSRTTVREALLMLERTGLVQSLPRKGTFVTHLSPAAASDLCTARVLLEGYAIHAGFPRFNTKLFTELRRLTAEMNCCVLPRDVPRIMELDMAFHGLLVEHAQSPQLTELWSSLNGQMRALYLYYLEHFGVTTPDRIVMMHERLVEELSSQDLLQAQREVSAHYFSWNGTTNEMQPFLDLFVHR